MAKYVCDFDQVNQIGEKVCEAATEMESSIMTYSTNMDSDLNDWSGNAKNAFSITKEKQVGAARQDCAYIKELGEFIKLSSQTIRDLEEQLAGQSI